MIIVYSKKEMLEAYRKGINNSYLLISIIGHKDNNWPNISGIKTIDILLLRFDDVDEYQEVEGRAYYPISENDVHNIVDFINKYSHEIKNDIYDLYVHCEAGISRSAGVAAAISKIVLGNDDNFFNNGRYKPNMTAYSAILKYYYASCGVKDYI